MGQYDPAARKRAVRKGREKGCWVFIPASELEGTGVRPPDGGPPWYRVWHRKRAILVQLYADK